MLNKKIHKKIERLAFINVFILILFISLYLFIYKIDWTDLYKTQNREGKKYLTKISESCNQCHSEVKGFSIYHNPQKIGCSSCHLGNPLTKNKIEAHKNMILIPGNVSNAKITCGQINCHSGIAERIDSSLMSTMSGIVSVNKYAFGEIKSPMGKFDISKIGFSASESHLRNLCASCHLGNEKNEYGPVTELSRGGGCNACHLNYDFEALHELKKYDSLKISNPDSALLKFHPSLTLNITNEHCFGCHSRSGRISTSYEGWHETSLTKDVVINDSNYRLLEDGRVFKMIQPDVHFQAGLVCVDCHISYEVMGDGKFYEHKKEQIIVQCEDCHSKGKIDVITLNEFDYESKKIAEINNITDNKRKFIKIKQSQTPLINTYLDKRRQPKLIGKQSRKTYNLNPSNFICTESKSHKNLSCNSCHTSWAPQCVGCHTEFETNTEGFDLLSNKEIDSTWVEYHGEFFAELPTLGIREETKNVFIIKKVETFIPGMIMTLDKSDYTNKKTDKSFKRFFAPTVAHTIQKESRSCESCHNNPLALGYGRGELKYEIRNKIGSWKFIPKYQNVKYDNLPEDAWIGFLQTRTKNMATRENARPFNIEEQKRILTVGTCLTCHSSDSDIIKESVNNFDKLLRSLSHQCILPNW